jgi:hypothetical protein
MQRLIICAFLGALSFCGSSALAQGRPSKCLEHADPGGCMLNLAKRHASSVKDVNERAETVAKLLGTYVELRRTDFELFEQASALVRVPKLQVDRRLELHTALSSYLWNIDRDKAIAEARSAAELFFSTLQREDPKQEFALYLWTCGLIDGNTATWKINAHLVAAYCTPDRMKHMSRGDGEEARASTLMTLIAAWIQSDYEQLHTSRAEMRNSIEALETVGIKNKSKSANIATQSLRVVQLTFETEMFRRSGLHRLADQTLAQAREALAGMEKLTQGAKAVEARLAFARLFNVLHDFEETIKTLKPIFDRFDSQVKAMELAPALHVDFLTTLAHALDEGGFKDQLEAKAARLELRMRQADVLYERYLAFLKREKDATSISPATIGALTAAAEAGHVVAMHSLAVRYANGTGGVTKNRELAFYWYSWAAMAGFPGSQNNLGDLYEKSQGSNNEIGLAVYWYTQAAMQGEPTAYLSLGELFIEGKGIPKNDVSAAVWLSLAARELPDGVNMAKAKRLRDEAIGRLDENARRYVERRVIQFSPHRQTEHRMGDKPRAGNWL